MGILKYMSEKTMISKWILAIAFMAGAFSIALIGLAYLLAGL